MQFPRWKALSRLPLVFRFLLYAQERFLFPQLSKQFPFLLSPEPSRFLHKPVRIPLKAELSLPGWLSHCPPDFQLPRLQGRLLSPRCSAAKSLPVLHSLPSEDWCFHPSDYRPLRSPIPFQFHCRQSQLSFLQCQTKCCSRLPSHSMCRRYSPSR